MRPPLLPAVLFAVLGLTAPRVNIDPKREGRPRGRLFAAVRDRLLHVCSKGLEQPCEKRPELVLLLE
jgi:hypothetical protein